MTTGGPPGLVGPQGPAGADGEDGISPFTTSVLGTEEMPAEGDTVDVTVATDTSWVVVGEPLFVQFWGTMLVTAVTADPKIITLQNLEDTASGAYPDNAAPGTVLTAGARISPTGWQGPTGPSLDPSLFFQVANDLSEGNAFNKRANLGLGSAAVFNCGFHTSEIPNITSTLQAGESIWFDGTGIYSKNAVNARFALGLGAASLYQAGTINGVLVPVDQVGGLVNGQIVFATGSGIESVSASVAKTRLGISSGGNPPMLLFQHISAGNGGTFSSGSRQTVPLNTKVVDTDSQGSIAGNQVTLAAGTYRYRFCVVGNRVDNFVGYLYSISSGTILNNAGSGLPTYGTNGMSDSGSINTNSYSLGEGRITLAASTVLELSAECKSSIANVGFGVANGFTPSGNYYYSWLELTQEL